AGAFRGAELAVRGGQSSGVAAATAVVYRGAADPALPVARMPAQCLGAKALVSRSAGGNRRGNAGGASGPAEPPGDPLQAEPLSGSDSRLPHRPRSVPPHAFP